MPELTDIELPRHPPHTYSWREQFTLAWLHAVCAPNLATALKPEVDEGVDASLRFRRGDAIGHLETQLKSITPDQAARQSNATELRYTLSASRAQKLTDTIGFPVGLFVVIQVPTEPASWSTRDVPDAPGALRISNRSWWSLLVRDNVAIPEELQGLCTVVSPDVDVRIALHHENHLDVFSLCHIFDRASAWMRRGVAA